MRQGISSKLSTLFFHITSNLNTIKYYKNCSERLEIKHISLTYSNFSTGCAGGQKGDYHRALPDQESTRAMPLLDVHSNHLSLPQGNESIDKISQGARSIHNCQIGVNVPRRDKLKFLVNTLSDLKDSKEAIYSALDAWVAWERNFPLVSLKRALVVLEKDAQWHRVIQVIKWMLSKGQGTTMGTYEQLVRALDKDHRAEEAHKIWEKKIGNDLHSVTWQFCNLMISIYYRNKMFERLIKLFKGLESFDRKPTDKSIVQTVADAYELLGMMDEKRKTLEKYNYLFDKSNTSHGKLSNKVSRKMKKKGPVSSEESEGRKETAYGQILETANCPHHVAEVQQPCTQD